MRVNKSFKKLTIIMIAYNEKEYVDLSIRSIRMFADIEDISVILVDNGSTDGLKEWASVQTDITFVYMDEGHVPFGWVINEVINSLQITGDILLMNPHFMMTKGCLSRMQYALYASEKVGAVGPVSNGFPNYQRATGWNQYIEAAQGEVLSDCSMNKTVMGLCAGVIMFQEEALKQLGRFDDTLSDETYVVRDFCFRMIMNDWNLMCCSTSLFWDARNSGYSLSENREDEEIIEKKWGMHCFNSMYNGNLIGMITESAQEYINVLEIGCDCGATLLEIKNRYPNAKIYGSEINAQAAEVASHIANVQVNNIEEQNLVWDTKFDYIIFGDVLEHLRDPLKTVLYCKSMLKKGGCIIASIPNVMHISVVENLLHGDFTYTETGLLDKTHVHLFTYNEIVRMFQTSGYSVDDVRSVGYPLAKKQTELIDCLLSIDNSAERFMYETFQYVVRAKIEE